MSPATNAHEKNCPACGLIFRWRNGLDLAWRDQRYCSSVCQRRASLDGSARQQVGRRTHFPAGTRKLDPR